MDKRTTENLIEDALNSQKPDKRVLSAAKEVMADKKTRRSMNTWQFYALASCGIILIVTGIVFTLPVSENLFTSGTNSLNISGSSYGLIIGIILIVEGILAAITAIIFRIRKKR